MELRAGLAFSHARYGRGSGRNVAGTDESADDREGVMSFDTRGDIWPTRPWPWSTAIKRFNPWALGVLSPTFGIPPSKATVPREASNRIL